jgi:hypothetical protein
VVTELVRLDHPALIQGGFQFGFFTVRLNDAGRVVFATTDVGPGNNLFALGVYLITNGEVRPIAHRGGTVAPDGSTFAGAGSPSLNARGDVAFRRTLSNPFSGPSGVFVFSDETLTQIARAGDVVAEDTLPSIGAPTIDAQGRIAFDAVASSPGRPSQIATFLFSSGVVGRLVGAGDPTLEGDTLASAASPWFNALGQLTFADSVGPFDRVYRLTDEGISRVAGQGDAVPATPRVVSASTSSIRRLAQPMFVASIFPGVAGIFDANHTLRVRFGDAVPGGGAIVDVPELTSNETGTVAFSTALSSGGTGIFLSHGNGALIEVARHGSPMPGGGTFFFPSDPSVNAAGQVAFAAGSSSPQGGICLASNGTIASIVRVGDPAPEGGQFTEVMAPSLNDSGRVAFFGAVSSPGRSGIFISKAAGVIPIVRVGDPAPGGGIFSSFSAPHLNAVGQVAFGSSSLGSDDVSGIFLFSPDEGLRSVMREGDPAPGGGTFTGFSSLITLDNRGQVAFPNFVEDPPGAGAFLFDGGNLEVIARPSDPAPGGESFTSASDPKLTADGDVLFTARTSSMGTAVTGVFLARRPSEAHQVRIDIRPAGQANRINPASDRLVPVAILSDAGFDSASVVADTVRFGATGTEAAPVSVTVRDVDGDGDLDMVLRFRIQDTGIQCGQTSALLTGQTSSGHTIAASDVVRTIGCR